MNILLIGSGGREHALAWAINRSPKISKLYAMPGNGGINRIAEAVSIDADDFAAIADFCQKESIDYVVVGPEIPLVTGITDYLESKGIKTFGSSKAASQLEGSKHFTKELCRKYNIPTAASGSFTDAASAKEYVRKNGAPIVVKADGLAAGKGVIIAQNEDEAIAAIGAIFGGKFGDAGARVVIEEFLDGEEASFFAISDGKNVISFGDAQDHKRVGEGDTGPNTGGMGTYSPAPVLKADMYDTIMKTIIQPTIDGLANDGTPFKGVLFAGLMIKDGDIQLLEYNIRFGDPEAQVLMPRLETDIVDIIAHTCAGTLDQIEIKLNDKTAVCVVMASEGYPGNYEKNTEISNLEQAESLDDTIIFHAGTKYDGDKCLAIGGRVLGVTALGDDIQDAQNKAYKAVDTVRWDQGFCRRDIGWRAINRLKEAC